ncbi:hypothetical protein [Microbacterium sediminis]|uniref:Uncharacterized protein n=1 Tax=Microbacterium sediminis TaxID=904291 RepID=A0A1B9NGM0_9MICO|nr:hypothetical protein [Microbacterium sediminis]OCG75742.1 hypothetical protein A7J15_01450 [Microbacterium sediminis]QBR74136.1 hypothetical protein E3O41_06710 [Microbacterium sediminis]
MTAQSENPYAPAHAILLLDTEHSGIVPFINELTGEATLPEDVPLPRMKMGVNGVDLDLSVVAAPLQSDLLGFALATSPLRGTLEPAVARHRAHLRILAAPAEPFAVQRALMAATARLASRDDVTAVLLPHQEALTTDVMYVGEAMQRPALTWFRTNAAGQGDGTSIAFTRGMWALGGTDVVLQGVPWTPAEAFSALRAAVATALEAERPPREGDTLEVSGVPHTLETGVDPIDGRPVLRLVAAG